MISIHSLPKEGDATAKLQQLRQSQFQSTPSPRRETEFGEEDEDEEEISIHSLPKEGDGKKPLQTKGGVKFQSTPSPRRETG